MRRAGTLAELQQHALLLLMLTFLPHHAASLTTTPTVTISLTPVHSFPLLVLHQRVATASTQAASSPSSNPEDRSSPHISLPPRHGSHSQLYILHSKGTPARRSPARQALLHFLHSEAHNSITTGASQEPHRRVTGIPQEPHRSLKKPRQQPPIHLPAGAWTTAEDLAGAASTLERSSSTFGDPSNPSPHNYIALIYTYPRTSTSYLPLYSPSLTQIHHSHSFTHIPNIYPPLLHILHLIKTLLQHFPAPIPQPHPLTLLPKPHTTTTPPIITQKCINFHSSHTTTSIHSYTHKKHGIIHTKIPFTKHKNTIHETQQNQIP